MTVCIQKFISQRLVLLPYTLCRLTSITIPRMRFVMYVPPVLTGWQSKAVIICSDPGRLW